MALTAYLTNGGYNVLNRLIASQGTLEITKAELGAGVCSGESECRARTSLVSKTCDASLVDVAFTGGEATITVQYINAGLAAGFFVNELGVYVKNPQGGADVLYCYVTFADNPDWIAPESSAQYVRTYDIKTIISSLSSMVIQTSPSTLVTRGEFNDIVAPQYSSKSTYVRGDFTIYGGKLYRANDNIAVAEAFNPLHWDEHNVAYYLARNEFVTTRPRFGVQGVGGSKAALTRLWDSVGKNATPGTDTIATQSDFDNYAPFNRRKCVGTWAAGTGRAVFTVNAYYGDADYVEDGTMGNYVAVEIEPFYYIEDGDIIGVSAQQFPGWKIHPVCVDKDGNIRSKTYIPCYPITLDSNGDAVSLPGGHNVYGAYKTLRDYAKSYAEDAVSDYAIIEPSDVDHYEWLLETIEFATQNIQSVMQGACSMPYNGEHKIIAAPSANKIVLPKAQSTSYVVGQSIYICNAIWTTPSNASAYNLITALEACDAAGTPTANGEYTLITYDGTDRSDSVSIGTTLIASAPWLAGACVGAIDGIGAVLGHTGSPVSNTDGRHPMMYRWRENTYGNQFMTAGDLFDVRVEDGTDAYHIEWYYLPDQTSYEPSANAKPDLNDLASADNGFVKLKTITPPSEYKNGYVNKLGCDDEYPTVKVPVMTGGSSTTYYCDYASLVSASVVRSVRRRGIVYDGAVAGLRCFYAYGAPSYADWYSGAGLFFIQ